MTTLATNVATLTDWAKRLDPEGRIADIIMLLNQTNQVLDDMQWIEGNLPTGHRTIVQTGLPTVAWRLLNGFATVSKGTTAVIDEGTGILEGRSEIDKDLAALNGNSAEYRFSEAQMFIEAMNQSFVSTLFYGNSGLTPEQFTGLSVRYSSTTAGNGQNVILGGSAGGQTDCASIWLVVWGNRTVHGIFPKGSKAGLIHEDKGEQTVYNATGIGAGRLDVLADKFQWKCGIALRDWRYVVRIANIDIGDNNADYVRFMIRALAKVPTLSMGKAAFYMNRTIMTRLDLLRFTNQQSGAGFTWTTPDGQWQPSFRGVPVRTTDQLLNTETAIS